VFKGLWPFSRRSKDDCVSKPEVSEEHFDPESLSSSRNLPTYSEHPGSTRVFSFPFPAHHRPQTTVIELEFMPIDT